MSKQLDEVRAAFAQASRPEHFTDYTHCDECREHDETLQAVTPDTISLEQLGNPGWDPICFINTEGFNYYLPGLARLTEESRLTYLDQLLFHLNCDRIQYFTPQQRATLATWLKSLKVNFLADDDPTYYLMCSALEQLEATEE